MHTAHACLCFVLLILVNVTQICQGYYNADEATLTIIVGWGLIYKQRKSKHCRTYPATMTIQMSKQ